MGYQERDFEVVDYDDVLLSDLGQTVRGPLMPEDRSTPALLCLGAAQTFGCYSPDPWPALLAKRLGVHCANYGFGGAHPKKILETQSIQDAVSRATAIVLQVTSARLYPNGLVRHGSGGTWQVRSEGVWREVADMLEGYELLYATETRAALRAAIEESCDAWASDNLRLLQSAGKPTLLLWFARRTPNGGLGYPQLIGKRHVDRIKEAATIYAEVVSTRGDPHYLVSRFTGAPIPDAGQPGGRAVNAYYPTPEMHEDVAQVLHFAIIRSRAFRGALGL